MPPHPQAAEFRAALKLKGWTMAEFGRRYGVTQPMVSRVLAGDATSAALVRQMNALIRWAAKQWKPRVGRDGRR